MLSCNGLLVIPHDNQLKKFNTEKGCYFDFVAVSMENGTENWHQYHIKMWVSTDEVELWEKRIEPNKIFLLKWGEISALYKEKEKLPFTYIKVNPRNLLPMAKLHYEKKET